MLSVLKQEADKYWYVCQALLHVQSLSHVSLQCLVFRITHEPINQFLTNKKTIIHNHIVNQIAKTKFISEKVDFFSPIPRLVHIERRDNLLGKPSCTVRSNEMKNEFPYSKWKSHYLVVILVAE